MAPDTAGSKSVEPSDVALKHWDGAARLTYNTGKRPPYSLSFTLIRLLFQFVLRVFYSTIHVEGSEHIPPDGVPCFLVANHSNSLTDALLLVTTVPREKRRLIRLTAKATQFGRGTFTSWLIESAGTLPIMRPKDYKEGQPVDNAIVFGKLIKALEAGDQIAMFPEGMSRYHPQLAPLRQGVARIISDTLARNAMNDKFQLCVQTCSITYLHRNLFRSDVLVTFHEPLVVSPRTHPELVRQSDAAIRSLTSTIASSIRSGMLDAPSWTIIRAAHTARRLYAPLGTRLDLGSHVRLTQRFVEGLGNEEKRAEQRWSDAAGVSVKGVLKTPMRSAKEKAEHEGGDYFAQPSDIKDGQELDVKALVRDLQAYQNLLHLHGIKDDRVRRDPRTFRRRVLLKRLLVRLGGASVLFAVSLPGLFLWAPIFLVARSRSEKMKRGGPVWDTYDEIAQTKLVTGLLTGVVVWFLFSLATFPILPLSIVVFPVIMWLTLRWLEDLTSSLRASLSLFRLLWIGKAQLMLLRNMREDLRMRVEVLAVERCGLPADAEKWFVAEERAARRRWVPRKPGFLDFFSIKRRRKKDWNEALKLSDTNWFPEDDDAPPGPVPVRDAANAGDVRANGRNEGGLSKGPQVALPEERLRRKAI
ncbi:hypothetical protein OIV83_006316 [Microbotryomycetes sp. JL201]|nr:hypothetical protein OIV83_006316 [Microbotryomycetes sp. JL201]